MFALLRYFNPYFVLPALAIPFALTTEAFTTGLGTPLPIPFRSQLNRLAWVIGLASIIGWLGYTALYAGYPTVMTPLPFLSVILPMYECPLAWVIGLPVIAFMATIVPSVWLVQEGLPVRFYILLIAASAATVYWLVRGWNYATRYQSSDYAIGVTVVNLLALTVLWIALWMLRTSCSFSQKLAFAAAIFFWLFSVAFPWMGELP